MDVLLEAHIDFTLSAILQFYISWPCAWLS